jgi:hypothetical protein
LAEAATTLQRKYGIRINYEDPVYAFDGDLIDGADPKYRIAHPGVRALIPRGGSVSWAATFQKGSANRLSNPLGLLLELTSSHATNGNPGTFLVREQQGIYFIVPAQVRGADGKLIAQSSPLDLLITLQEKERSGLDTVRDILQAVSKGAGMNVGMGTLPMNLLFQTTGTIGALNEPARSVLIRALEGLHWNGQNPSTVPMRKIDWQMFYDANSRDYTFNAHIVTVETQSPAGGVILRPL